MIWRKVGGVVLGVLVAGVVVALGESGAHGALSGEAVFGAVCVAQGVAAAVGGGLAAKVGRSGVLAWIVAAVLFALSLANAASFAHPGWFVPVVAVALGAGGWLGSRV